MIIIALFAILFPSCAQGLSPLTTASIPQTPSQTGLAENYIAGKFSFYYQDYYSLSAPNPITSCAGDAKNFYDPFLISSTSGMVALPQDQTNPSSTLRPAFIKNIAVDLTDANASLPLNLASHCSLTSANNGPPTSNCATFDYGSIDGIRASLEGSLLLFGGMQTPDRTEGLSLTCGSTSSASNTTSCLQQLFALSVNTLPPSSATGLSQSLAPGLSTASTYISSWLPLFSPNLFNTSTKNVPPATSGASISYDSDLNELILLGGAAKTSTGGIYTHDTWIYNLQTQTWLQTSPSLSVSSDMQTQKDANPIFNTISYSGTVHLTKNPGGRALFGYTSVPGTSLQKFSLTGLVSEAGIDTTDRIFIVGGYCNTGTCSDILRFNPTYAPEYIDIAEPSNPVTSTPNQWIDSYHTQILNNSSFYTPSSTSNLNLQTMLVPSNWPAAYPPVSNYPAYLPQINEVNFGLVPITNNNSSTSGIGPKNGISGTGYLATVGGFYGYSGNFSQAGTVNTPAASSTLATSGGLQMSARWFDPTQLSTSEANEKLTGNFGSVSNDWNQQEATPLAWIPIPDQTGKTAPWFGGGVMLRGLDIDLTSSNLPLPQPTLTGPVSGARTNQVVYFGGSDCRDYLSSTSTCPRWNPAQNLGNPGRYWIFGTDPFSTFAGGSSFPTALNMASPSSMNSMPPLNAGMAAARGLDPTNHPIIIAFGGASGPASVDSPPSLYYLYADTSTKPNTPTWVKTTVSGTAPLGLANASLVFSHVTGKFYLFGGWNPNIGTVGDTWELTLTNGSSTQTCGLASSTSSTTNCLFSWRLLSTSSAMTCYPNCPQIRHSHRMVEANYHYVNAPNEPTCNMDQPCSFGLFMEGGTYNTTTYFNERWMFDPTANAGGGHWQRMDELPPRTRAASSSIDYAIPTQGITVHRTLVFGGETGMQNPFWGNQLTQKYFSPPTLGDTWMYDADANSWNRVTLNGIRFSSNSASLTNFTEAQIRSSSLNPNTKTQILSPPPLSGAMMITRTLSKPNHRATDSQQPLLIPEVFLLGGRTKDGFFPSLNKVYKFCSGSTGEKPTSTLSLETITSPDDATCDGYSSTNLNSTSPSSAYTGAWIAKNPTSTPTADLGSFRGGAAYDSVHDLIVTYGGLMTSNISYPITDTAQQVIQSSILEYTPPSSVGSTNIALTQGTWNQIATCANSPLPQARYGHSMGYDALRQAILVVGGYDINGNLLIQTQTPSFGSKYTMPEVWSAFRIDQSLPQGMAALGIPPITTSTPCYYWSQITNFGNSTTQANTSAPTAISEAASVFIPSSGYNTGFYTTNDNSCINAGPIASTNNNINSLLTGHAYLDIDRTQLNAHENLLLNLTFFLKGDTKSSPIFHIQLVKTGLSGETIRNTPQPRSYAYSSTQEFPIVATLSTLVSPGSGRLEQNQIVIPLSLDPGIDRIQIERYSGNAILIDATLFRTSR